MPAWLSSTLNATPAFLWVLVVLGGAWALVLLPRHDWRDLPLVGAVSIAAGTTLLTMWMFILGTLGALTRAPTLAGVLALTLVGAALAWRKRQPSTRESHTRPPLDWDERLLIALIGAALVVRWFDAAFWSFTAYDALWVYGYQGRLYTLVSAIPNTIGYYPQYLPLQYTFGQLVAGGIDDHAARAGLIGLQLGSILATYVLASRLFTSRRAGVFAAAIWALYPHLADWSRFGDLEVPLTFLFTLAAAFFLMAWRGDPPRRRYALLAGLTLGAALWTKPTAGAFVWGMLLMLAIAAVRVRGSLNDLRPRLTAAFLTLVAAAPLGGVWYVRNLLLGHAPVVLPPGFWQTLAQRSGAEFGWLIVLLLACTAYLFRPGAAVKPDVRRTLAGFALLTLALAPSILYPHRLGAPDWLSRHSGAAAAVSAAFGMVEIAALLGGAWLVAAAYTAALRRQPDVGMAAWMLVLAAPYFVTWFWSYSYHYRLSFAIVPLLVAPSAWALALTLSPHSIRRWQPLRRRLYGALLVALALHGVLGALYDVNEGMDWLWSDRLPDDAAKYRSGNAALMAVVDGIQAYIDQHGEPPVVAAPNVQRLPFFFPTADIRLDAPTRLDDLRGVTYFVTGAPETLGVYAAVPPLDNQVLAGLTRPEVAHFAWGMDDGIFRYDVYELFPMQRFVKPRVFVPIERGDLVIGGFARLMGHEMGGNEFWEGRRVMLRLYWEVLAPPPHDYSVFIHVRDEAGTLLYTWDSPIMPSPDGRYAYSTLLWQPKEYVTDSRLLTMDTSRVPFGTEYRLWVGMYSLTTGERLTFTLNGKPYGDSWRLRQRIDVVPVPPEEAG